MSNEMPWLREPDWGTPLDTGVTSATPSNARLDKFRERDHSDGAGSVIVWDAEPADLFGLIPYSTFTGPILEARVGVTTFDIYDTSSTGWYKTATKWVDGSSETIYISKWYNQKESVNPTQVHMGQTDTSKQPQLKFNSNGWYVQPQSLGGFLTRPTTSGVAVGKIYVAFEGLDNSSVDYQPLIGSLYPTAGMSILGRGAPSPYMTAGKLPTGASKSWYRDSTLLGTTTGTSEAPSSQDISAHQLFSLDAANAVAVNGMFLGEPSNLNPFYSQAKIRCYVGFSTFASSSFLGVQSELLTQFGL